MLDRNRILATLKALNGDRALRGLLVRILGYESGGGLVSGEGWPEGLDGEPELFASAGREGRFAVIRARFSEAGKLSLGAERRVMERLRDAYPYALFVFSDSDDSVWHFVNAPHGERAAKKQYRRIVVGPNEGLRTATDRISLLSVDDLADKLGKEPEELSPLEVQAAHDEAFDVEAVTKEFFREYRRVFVAVEESVAGIEDEGRRRFFVQRLFNRLMFVAFVEKKRWMRLGGRTDYLTALWDAYSAEGGGGGSFYCTRLKPLFFRGFNTEDEHYEEGPVIGSVPYLNGGLFEEGADDADDAIDVPDEGLREILVGLFGRFNFTTTESTPLDTEVAVDPEMLGKVFEELVTGRHDVGAYYTPKPIVSFMCREALKGHLEKELGISEDTERETIRAFVEEHDSERLADPEGALEALRSVRVCDPACGSGAYLLGMLRELLDLRESLFAARNIDPRTTYQRKLEIIQNNLYGVDLEEFAINIARLRLWLSLVVDYEGERPPPLPNLEFKVEVGDSLLGPNPTGGIETPDMFRAGQVGEYFRLKGEYLKAHGESKAALREKVVEVRQEIAEWAHPGKSAAGFDWEVEFAEAFAEGGFDVIVANPPYIRMELFKEIKPTLRKNFPKVHSDRADLYVYFYGRALQLLKTGGMLAFISSNKWFRANYGAKLRKHIAETCHISSITDFGDLPVFESAIAYPMIFIMQKQHKEGVATAFTQVKTLEPPYPDVAAVVRKVGYPLPPEALGSSDWRLTDAASATRLRKMRAGSTPLGEYVEGQIHYGIKTGFNEAFVISSAQRTALVAADPNSAEIIKPLITGRDARKWWVRDSGNYLLYMYHNIDAARFPAVVAHLQSYKESLERRATKQAWYELQQPQMRSTKAYDRPKIVYPQIMIEPRFTFDYSGAYINQKCFVIAVDDLYLLGLLNSSAIWQLILDGSPILRGGYVEPRRKLILSLPITNAPAADREAITELVQDCLDAKGVGCEAWEAEIDERVAYLYGVSLLHRT